MVSDAVIAAVYRTDELLPALSVENDFVEYVFLAANHKPCGLKPAPPSSEKA